jgi:hypothetical protein
MASGLCAAGVLRPVENGRADVAARAIRRRLGGGEKILHLALPCGTTLPLKDTLLNILRDGANAKDGEIGTVGQWRSYLKILDV